MLLFVIVKKLNSGSFTVDLSLVFIWNFEFLVTHYVTLYSIQFLAVKLGVIEHVVSTLSGSNAWGDRKGGGIE